VQAKDTTPQPPETTGNLLDRLSFVKNRFTPVDRQAKVNTLRALQNVEIHDIPSLIQFHEILCFLRAYPDGPEVLRLVDEALGGFASRVDLVKASNRPSDLKKLRDTGIVHTTVYYPYPHEMANWLVEHFPKDVDLDWEDDAGLDKIRAILPFAVAYAENDILDDEGVSLRDWVRAAKGKQKGSDLQWLLATLNRSSLPPEVVRHLYNDAELLLGWELRDATASRTLAKFPTRRIFYHESPLLRGEVDFWDEVQRPLCELIPISRKTGEALIHLFRSALSVRHREFHPLLHANPRDVWMANVDRGLRIVLVGVLPEFRLPLEGYYGFLALKNGVPVGYGGGGALLDRMECAGNIFESFRQGESIFVFSQVFRTFYQLCGSRCFLVPRYQVGYENDEALTSGAFWFYHKLGFRPEDPGVLRLSEEEHVRIKADPSYRCSRRILERLAQSNMILYLAPHDPRACEVLQPSDLGLLISRHIARRWNGDRTAAIRAASESVSRRLSIASWRRWPPAERMALERLSPILVLIPDLAGWTPAEKRAVVRIVKAKGASRETDYIRLLRGHARLSRALVDLARSAAPSVSGTA
jgi:hypothetical protein